MTEVISVRFRSGCKNYFFDPGELEVKMGEQVVVETAQGPEFATCTQGNHDVEESAIVKPLSPVLRMATDADRRTVDRNRKREREAFDICEKKIAAHGLEMKLVNELRQIGVRDEAKMIGGLGICGRPFCCSQFLDGFLPVSIKMAKTQNLSLNPTKISGTCGRLMCCLKYEQNAYEDAAKRMPKAESFVQTPDGPGNVKGVDLLREMVKVSLDSAPEGLKTYHNCEVCVLRNGKGSREGIVIPAERPARYVEELVEEDLFAGPILSTPFYMSPELEEAPIREKIGGPGSGDGKARRKHRGGRRRGGKTGAPKPEPKSEQVPAEKRQPPKAAKGGDKPSRQDHRNEPKGEPRPQQPERRGEALVNEGGEAKRRRSRHRGGRRRSKGGEGGSAPKGEE